MGVVDVDVDAELGVDVDCRLGRLMLLERERVVLAGVYILP